MLNEEEEEKSDAKASLRLERFLLKRLLELAQTSTPPLPRLDLITRVGIFVSSFSQAKFYLSFPDWLEDHTWNCRIAPVLHCTALHRTAPHCTAPHCTARLAPLCTALCDVFYMLASMGDKINPHPAAALLAFDFFIPLSS